MLIAMGISGDDSAPADAIGPWSRLKALAQGPALVLAVAFAVRLSYLSGIVESPFYDVRLMQGTDPYNFYQWALAILAGKAGEGGVFYQSPLYPYLLALIFRVSGSGLMIPRLVNSALGSGTAVLAYFLGRRLLDWRAGLLAGLAEALCGPMIFYEGAILRDGPVAFLDTAFLLALLSGRDRPGLGRGALIGALWGVAVLGKPNVLIMAPVVAWSVAAVWRGWAGGGPREPSGRAALALSLGALAGFAVVLGPVAARNVAQGVPALALDAGGPKGLVAGNLPTAPWAGLEMNAEALSVIEESHGSVGRAALLVLRAYRGRPLDLFIRQLRKTWVLLDGYEVPNNMNYYVEQRYVAFLRGPWLTWPILMGAAAIGAWTVRRRWREQIEFYAYLALTAAGIVGFFVLGRFRTPLIPLLSALAGAGAIGVFERARARQWRSALLAAAIAGLITAVLWPRPADPLRANDYSNLARYHMLRNEPDRARAWADEGKGKARSLVAQQGGAENSYRLARLEYLAGDPLPTVEAELARASAAGPSPWHETLIRQLEEQCRDRQSDDPLTPGGFRFK